jgi:serine/threonine protein kinase, bacterial
MKEMTGVFQRLTRALLDRVAVWKDFPYPVGTRITNRFVVQQFLGSGSYGNSYVCQDLHTGSLCVLKQLKPSRHPFWNNKPEPDSPIFRESELLAQLDHPGIPKLIECFAWRNSHIIAMELMEGHCLEHLIFSEGVRYNEVEALQIVDRLLEIIHYLHSHHIVHRDIRIPNVIMNQGYPKLIDFGLARFVHTPADNSELEELEDMDSDTAEEKRFRRRIQFESDYYALGHFLLFLLYSGYQEVPSTQAVPSTWEEELTLTPQTRRLIRRLLETDSPFSSILELQRDVRASIEQAAGICR